MTHHDTPDPAGSGISSPGLPRLACLPPHADVLDWAACRLVEHYRTALPDLSHLTLIVPAAAQIARLRRLLLARAGGALLGPCITTLAGYSRMHAERAPLPTLDCKLLLADVLRQHPDLFVGHDRWALADALYALFEELSATTPELATDADRFVARIARGYGSSRLSQISAEAQTAHLLWSAYLQDTQGRNPGVAHLRALAQSFAQATPQSAIYLIGHDYFSRAESRILNHALEQGALHLWLQGPLTGRGREALTPVLHALGTPVIPDDLSAPDARAQRLLRAFDDSGPTLRERAIPGGQADSGLRLAAATSPEHEARLVDLAVRRALLTGQRDITIVTQDRRLARRLRALLERAQIPLRDESGWALSTSAAAASLGHWLDCCEQDFPFRALLDLLKSTFFDGVTSAEIGALETSIYASGTVSGLDRLIALDGAPRPQLAALRRAARLLPASNAPAQPGQDWAASLIRSLQALPLWTQWQTDAAGMVLATALQDLQAALQRQGSRLRWQEFRELLERTLEQATFILPSSGSPVRLLTLEQAQGLRCEFLILAGASAAQFPGKPSAEAVFNHGVRAELGLSNWRERLHLQLARLRALLHAAPQILISYAPEKEGEPAQPCPWIEALLALGVLTPDTELPRLANEPGVEIAAVPHEMPQPQTLPTPLLPAALLPSRLSAGRHQSLIDCPYQFFARSGLCLEQPREPDEPVSRRDFGERVHTIMQGFESQVPGLPAPFGVSVTPQNRAEAQHKLTELAQAVFADDLRSRALARVWLAEFLDFIPDIADWMAARSGEWPQVEPELSLKRALTPELTLHGRADRVESRADGTHCVVDFKSGQAPKADDVINGESVQATHYALLAENCTQVEYFVIHRDRKKPIIVEGDDLQAARAGVRQRLLDIFAARTTGIPMPANGNQKTCDYCDYAGLCRRGAWHE